MKYICYKCAGGVGFYTNKELTETSQNSSDAYEFSEEEKEFLKIRATNVGLYILGATCTSLEGLAFDK